jgi:hypothetical protein
MVRSTQIAFPLLAGLRQDEHGAPYRHARPRKPAAPPGFAAAAMARQTRLTGDMVHGLTSDRVHGGTDFGKTTAGFSPVRFNASRRSSAMLFIGISVPDAAMVLIVDAPLLSAPPDRQAIPSLPGSNCTPRSTVHRHLSSARSWRIGPSRVRTASHRLIVSSAYWSVYTTMNR